MTSVASENKPNINDLAAKYVLHQASVDPKFTVTPKQKTIMDEMLEHYFLPEIMKSVDAAWRSYHILGL